MRSNYYPRIEHSNCSVSMLLKKNNQKKILMELLPLALKVLGSSFYGRDKKHWRHFVDRLKRIPHNDILGKLRLSFDGLDKFEKELFLDIAFLDIACCYHALCGPITGRRESWFSNRSLY